MTHPAEGTYLHVRAAFINAIAEEGTKAEAVEWLQRLWNENCALRSQGGKALADAIAVIRAESESCPFREGPMADGWAEAWATFLNRLGDDDGLNNLYANSTAHSPSGKAPQMERIPIATLAKHFYVPIEAAKLAQDAIGFMYRELATPSPSGKDIHSCGAESNRHSGAVGMEKRAEQSNPGGGHALAPKMPNEIEKKAGPDEPTPGQPLRPPAASDTLRNAFRNVDDSDWRQLEQFIPDSGYGRFWKAVLKEVRAALSREERECTCHPDDNPPRPCPRKFALTECRKAASTSTEQRD